MERPNTPCQMCGARAVFTICRIHNLTELWHAVIAPMFSHHKHFYYCRACSEVMETLEALKQ